MTYKENGSRSKEALTWDLLCTELATNGVDPREASYIIDATLRLVYHSPNWIGALHAGHRAEVTELTPNLAQGWRQLETALRQFVETHPLEE